MSKSATLSGETKPAPRTVLDTQPRHADQPEPRRAWLSEDEVEAIIEHAATPRDKAMILICYRHGLRVSEPITIRWRDIDLDAARLAVHRLKAGEDSIHPLSGREMRALPNCAGSSRSERVSCSRPHAARR